MAGFTDAYNQIRTELETLFPTYNEIDNPYNPESCADLELKLAYGITINGAENTTRRTCSRLDISRDFGIVFFRRINATRNDTTTRIASEKALFEDLTKIIKVFEKKIPNVTLARYVNDSGIEFLGDDRYNNIILRSSFVVEYSEDL